MNRTPHKLQASYLRDLFFVLIFAAVLFYFIALLSYSPLDPSANSASFPPFAPKNFVGTLGASLSAFVIYYFGVGALVIPIPMLLLTIINFSRRLRWYSPLIFLPSPLLIFGGLEYFLYHYLPFIDFSGFDVSTVGRFGLWLDQTLYSKLGSVGSPAVAILLGAFGWLMLVRYENIFKKKLLA